MIQTLKSLAGPGYSDVWRPPPRSLRYDDPSQMPGASLENPRTSWDRIFDVQESYSGKAVTEISALQLTAVWRCVTLISGAVAKAPLNVYRRLPDVGKVKAYTHYLWPLLHREANDVVGLSAFRFRRMMEAWVLLWGNAYAEMEITGRGQIARFWPMRPDRMKVSGPPGDLLYTYTRNDGTLYRLKASSVLHLRGLETDGNMGISPIRAARQSLGLAMAAEEYGARYFGSSGRPGGWIEHQGKLGPASKQNLRESFEDLHRGLRGAHRIAIFEEGMKYHEVGVPPEDMQFLETRQFQGIDIARLFGVPPHKIAELSRATFSNIEHQSIEFVQDCLSDWFTNWEQELTVSCLSKTEAQEIFLEFNRDVLMHGDKKSRYEAYAIGRNGGWLTPNNILDAENMNLIPASEGGDDRLVPLNMLPTGPAPETDPDADPDDPGPEGGQPDPAAAAAAAKKAKKAAKKKKAEQPLSGGSEQ